MGVTTREVEINGHLTAIDVCEVAKGARVRLSDRCMTAVAINRAVLEDVIQAGAEVYGVTTGVGGLVGVLVDAESSTSAQRNLLRSHAAGAGADLPREVVRAAMAVRLNGLSLGYSGVRPIVLQRIADILNSSFTPRVPQSGSLGASGDLAPSAHAFLPLIGEGEVSTPDGTHLSGNAALSAMGLAPLQLESKEALALINGTQFMAGIGALVLSEVVEVLDTADVVGAVSVDALCGHTAAFDQRVTDLRRLEGQATSAANVRSVVRGSDRTLPKNRPGQDAYSVRCIPQVHGSARTVAQFFGEVVGIELDAITDNPIVLTSEREVVSAGNFHGQAVSVAFDAMRLALTDLAAISERRTYRLLSPTMNGGLGAFLSPKPGQNSGYMVTQYTAAALLSELRVFAQPVSIDSVPTSDGQEDHVSMGMTSALLALQVIPRVKDVLAIELLCACQALDLSPDLKPGVGTRLAHGIVRRKVEELVGDRMPSGDIANVRAAIDENLAARVLRST